MARVDLGRGVVWLWDTETEGFGLRVRSGERKAFFKYAMKRERRGGVAEAERWVERLDANADGGRSIR